ncbi:hypothetical protein AB0K00_27375 [Dactylosporangium sp. NPDC049525]|uniref:hypothetical protein n=1 Tax=Dactylosporangium sp. NPDC049525 TaxID=3154730 RepID=UPI00343632F9
MDIELQFVSQGSGAAQQHFTLEATDQPVTLPSPILINHSAQHLIVQSIRVSPAGPAAASITGPIVALWQPEIPQSGIDLPPYGRYLAPWRYLAGSALPPGQTSFTWSVTVAKRLADGRFQPLDPVRKQCVLVVAGAPVAPAPADVAPVAETQPPVVSSVPYDGWIAIDFGMSNSTITMFDQNQKRSLIGIPPTQTARLRECLTDLLNGTATDTFGLSGERWRQLLEGAGRTLNAAMSEDHLTDPLTQVKASLAGDRVFDVLLALDQEVDNALPAHRDALIGGLQRLYADVFGRPPIEELQLVPVPLHAGEPAVSSDAQVLTLDPFTLAMWADGDTGSGETVAMAVEHQPGLKRYVGSNRLLPGLPADAGGPSTDDALTALWRCLLEKVTQFRGDHGDRYADGEIRRAVVTYPTTAPPQTRIDMERLAHSVGLRIVDTRFDEATAAAMFSLMREFAGDHAVGVEAFRARSRQVGPDTWRYNILVIDVGGGSTDVALLALTLRDRTDRDPNIPADQQGRFYELRPTVLGKAGDLQLGGDRITLGIFHRLKAHIADLLLTASPGLVVGEHKPYLENGVYREGSLLAATGDEATSSSETARLDLIDEVVPTRWSATRSPAEEKDARERFRRLWDEAEKAKRASATTDRPYVLRNLQDLLQRGDVGVYPPAIEIDHIEIRAEIDKVLRRSMNIGLDVARKRLPVASDGSTEPLDKVILSGGTSALPRTRQLLQEVFTEETTHHGRGSLRWNPLHVVHDPAFAKIGTSIGACWAEHIHQKGFTDPRQAKQNVAMGRTEIHIDVDNLLHGLPYGLDLSATGMNALPVFRPGQEFERVGEAGEGAQRSAWMPAVLDLAINRRGVSPAEPAVLWGHLSLQELYLAEGSAPQFDLGEWVARVSVQFEIDEADLLTAHFCLGPPHYGLDMSGGLPSQHLAGPNWTDGQVRLYHDLLVNPDAAGGMANHGQPLLRRASEPDGYVVSPGEPALRCWVSRRFPRDVPNDGTWWIGRRDTEDPTVMHKVGTPFPAVIRHGRGADVRLVVDETGRVRPVLGFVPYLPAQSMTEVITHPGRVLSLPMHPGRIDLNGRFDPFNGSH